MEQITKKYEDTYEGKKAFVAEVFTPLLQSFYSGWHRAEYIIDEHREEWVILYTKEGGSRKICVSADSIRAIVMDVFRQLG